MVYRTRAGAAVAGNPLVSVQAGIAAGSAVDVPRKTRLGAVLLQGGLPRTFRPVAQEPASVHRHESDRSEPGAAHFSSKCVEKKKKRKTSVHGNASPGAAARRVAQSITMMCRLPPFL